jgi:hypothetical protein
MTPRVLKLLRLAMASVLLAGCEVEIGDECESTSDCSQSGPRLCLTEALEGYPGGYCTLFNCDPGGCPGEAVCVGYRSGLADTEDCAGARGGTRLQRTFCMRSCSSDGDCRGGYACLDLAGPDPWGAEILEKEGRNTKVCALAYSGPMTPEDRSSDVCRSEPQPPPTVTSAPEPSTEPSTSPSNMSPSNTSPSVDAGSTSGAPLDAGSESTRLDAGQSDASAAPLDAGRSDASAAPLDAGRSDASAVLP